MKILFILNSFYAAGNGLSASARRTVKVLREMGHEVRILSGPNLGAAEPQPDYLLKEYRFPFFQGIISANGYSYASSNPALTEEAVKWADVVHLEEPFVIEDKAIPIVKRLGKPLTVTYHLHPENITSAMGRILYWKFLNRIILRAWCNHTFNRCQYVQCPTENVHDRLRRYHLKSQMRVISNGLLPDPCIRPETPPADYEDPQRPLKVVCIGRFSVEKDQPTLLEAMRYSNHARRIQLLFAGQGPTEKKLRRKAQKLYEDGILAYPPEFRFCNRDQLRVLASEADLCIHCAFIEVEGLSIMEAIQQGAVPIIAEGRYTGTSQFAMDRHSIFPAKNPEALAHRIDYWLDRPKERWETGWKYVEFIKQYDIQKSVEQLVQMFQEAIDDKKKC
ncbi:MAG: glycosyltransferase [Bacteroidales bacterium]|nr:glycosyltransferase [Bacteroidales bacterium]